MKIDVLASGEMTTQDGSGATGYLTINLGALRRNYARLASRLAPACAAAVVKANAYGLGDRLVAETLYSEGCRHFFVAQFMEAERLRPRLPQDAQLFVLNGLQPGCEIACAQAGIIPVANSVEQLCAWSAAAATLGRVLPVVLQFDTGMSRLGIAPEDRTAVAALLKTTRNIEPLFIMSHLASADDPQAQQNDDQLLQMRRIAAEYPDVEICFANSGGIFLGEDFRGALARPGIALYGGAPNNEPENPMEPVVRLDVAVVQTRTVPTGTAVGYGATYVTTSPRRLATLAAGYADGLPRSLSGRGAAYYNGVRLPITGRVSMDSITIDVTDLPEGTLKLGSLVEIIGPHQTLEDLACDAGTISYEILTSLGDRYHRHIV